MNIYDFTVKDYIGKEISLDTYKRNVLLIVNTATECGFTPQYTGLQELYEKYHDKGFEILDFPSNQFKGQAPGTSQEIHNTCTGRFGITFKQFEKIDVNGDNEHPLYGYLKSEQKGLLGRKIKWNFTKFLIDRDGTVTKRFAPSTKPEKIENDIVQLLGGN